MCLLFSIRMLAYYVRLIPLGKPHYKPAGLNADMFSMPYGTVTGLCASVFVSVSFCLSLLSPLLPVCLIICCFLSFGQCTVTESPKEAQKIQSTGELGEQTHRDTRTHTHWRMAAIRWGNQACEDRGALRGCNRCMERVRVCCTCLCVFVRFLSL